MGCWALEREQESRRHAGTERIVVLVHFPLLFLNYERFFIVSVFYSLNFLISHGLVVGTDKDYM